MSDKSDHESEIENGEGEDFINDNEYDAEGDSQDEDFEFDPGTLS
jgi:hypothetical protein